MKKKICIGVGILLMILIVAGIVTNYIDSGRVATGHEPKYCIKIVNNDGSKVTYWGLGYKVIRYVGVSPNEPYESNIGVKMGNWFMKYKLPIDSEFNKENSSNISNLNDFYNTELTKNRDIRNLSKEYTSFDAQKDNCFVIGAMVHNDNLYSEFMENYKNSKIGQETAQKYGDIIEMERPQTEESLRKHPRMTLQNRAKIFSPFAALRGYDEQLAAEKQRTERVPKRILTEEEMSALSDRLMQVTKGMTITVRYFKEDTAHPEVPAVGNYITLTGKADRIDPVFRTLQVGDTVVPFEDLVEISGEGIMEIDQYLGITED